MSEVNELRRLLLGSNLYDKVKNDKKILSEAVLERRLESLQNNGCLTKIELETFKSSCFSMVNSF